MKRPEANQYRLRLGLSGVSIPLKWLEIALPLTPCPPRTLFLLNFSCPRIIHLGLLGARPRRWFIGCAGRNRPKKLPHIQSPGDTGDLTSRKSGS